MAILESNTDLDVKGRVLATTVPNSTGSIVTWNASTKVFGLRSNAQIISDLGLQSSLTAGSHINITSNSISAILTDGVWLEDSAGNRRIHVGSVSSTNDFLFRSRHTGFAEFKWQDAAGTSFMELNGTTFRVQGLGGTGISIINADSSGSLFRTGIDPSNIALQNGTYPNMTVGLATIATSATKLQTARTINGTSFNGTANITTANWGTARNITIGNTTKSVNGSANVAWSLAEIGIPTSSDFITTNTTQTGLTGNKTTSGIWNFISSDPTSINVIRTSSNNSSIGYGVSSSVQVYTGLADSSTFAIGDGGGIGNLNTVANRWMWVDILGNLNAKSDVNPLSGWINGQVTNYPAHSIRLGGGGRNYMDFFEYGALWNFYRSNSAGNTLVASISSNKISSKGYEIYGRTNSDIVLAGGGHRPVSDFALAGSLGNYVSKTGDVMDNNAHLTFIGSGAIIKKPNITGGWARNTLSLRASDDTNLDALGHYGTSDTVYYGYLGTTTYNTTTAIRWTPNADVGIGLGSTFTPTEKLDVNGNIRVRALTSSGFVKTNAQGVLSVDTNTYALVSQLPTVNDGQLTLSTGTGLSGSATFTANQAGSSTFSVAVASTHKLPTTAEWNALPTTNTITRLRGTTSGTYTSGDLTLLAGANTTITQSGSNITIASTNTNTTYTAGTGLSLSGTTFNVNYGTSAGTSAQGNDSRINNGQTAYGWGNHINMYVGGTTNPLADPGTYSGAHSALPLGSWVGILSTSATGFPSQATGGIFSFGRTATNITSRIFGSRQNIDGLWYSNGDPSTATIWQVASREWVASQNYLTSVDLTGFVPTSRTITAGNGLSGGGNLTANRTITLGTPSAITLTSTNSVTTSSHTHAFTPGGTTAQYIRGDGSLATMPTFTDAITTISRNGVNIPIVSQNVDIPVFSTTGAGLVPARVGSVATKYLREDGSWVTPTNTTYSNMAIAELNAGTVATARTISASVLNQWLNAKGFSTQTLSNSTSNLIVSNTVQRAALTGDVTAAQNSNATTIANSAVTHAKYQNIATQRILGRGAAGTGNVQELTLGANLSLSTSGVLSATNTNTTYSAGTGLSLSGTTFGQTITTSGSGTFVSSITQTANGFQVNLGTPSAGSSGIETIYTDNSAFSGPANDPEITFNFHEYWGFPAAFAEEYQPGNATAKANREQLDFFASYDSVQTIVWEEKELDVSLNGYHITNILLMSGTGSDTVTLEDGVYAGDQVNITTSPNQQIVIYANNLIATVGNEVYTFANLIWDCEQVAWVLVAYGTI